MAGARGYISEEFKEKHKVTYYLPMWIIQKMKPKGNQSKFVEDCIVKATGWEKEDNKKYNKKYNEK